MAEDSDNMASRTQRFARRVPDGDDRERRVCNRCDYVDYENPRIVTGSVATLGDRILLCRRAIEPRTGFWTLPAGFLEVQESVADGALREAWEEARAKLEIDALLAVYTIEQISQVQIFYRARLLSPEVSAGPESQEVGLFLWGEIPWDELAFPSVHWALQHWHETKHLGEFAPRSNP
jgi:ADP-ribose pyrophosphatase YjhB (NUDIX family)